MATDGHQSSMAERARRVIPGGVNSGQRRLDGLEDLVIVGTDGAYFTDDHGRTYVDFHAAFGPPLLGHNDPDVNRAVAETARRLGHPGVGVTPEEVQLAEAIVDAVPSVDTVLLTSTGSEATHQALRVARVHTGRSKILKFQGCYHGWHDAVAMNVISPPDRVGQKDPLSEGILPEMLDATLVVEFNDIDALKATFRDHGDSIAAAIVEPIPHNIGAILPVAGFLETLRQLCTQHGTVLVFDEVITGFRHDLGGMQAITGVMPDLTTLGKAMGNGYPVAAVGGDGNLMDLFSTRADRPAFFAGTFNGHPAMAAAALETIRKLRDEPVHEHIYRLGQMARDGLVALFDELNVDAVVSGYGSVFVTYFMEPPATTYRDLLRHDADLFVRYRREGLNHGVFELPLNLKRSHVSYAHTDGDIDRLLESTRASMQSVLQERQQHTAEGIRT